MAFHRQTRTNRADVGAMKGRGGTEDTNQDQEEVFDLWRQCIKCHQLLEEPKALPCLHTVCFHCLKIHYQTVKSQVNIDLSAFYSETWEEKWPKIFEGVRLNQQKYGVGSFVGSFKRLDRRR